MEKSLHGIKNRTFRRTGFYEYAKAKKYLDPVNFFEMVRERPYLERLIKAGLYHLAEDIMDNKAQIYCKDSGNLGKALGIDGFRLKRLRTNNGGEIFLQWLLLEKTQNKLIHDDVILWMCREKLKPADLMFIMDRMAPLQIKNYLEKQAAESGESVKDLIKTWKDWRKKCTWEEAVKYYIQKKETETPKMQFFYKGKRYKSVSACCAEYGVNASSVRNRAKTTECSIEESLDHFIKKARMETQPSVFIFRDKTYRSLEECCLEYGVNADSVSSRKYRLNCTMEESLEHFIENKDMIDRKNTKIYI